MTSDIPATQTDQRSLEQVLTEAVALHQAGELQEAEKCYRAILQAEPHHPKANHNLGALYVQRQQPAAGLIYFVAALEADPAHGQYWLSYIDALFQAGQWEESRQVLALARQNGLEGKEVDTLALHLEDRTQSKEASSASTLESRNSVQQTQPKGIKKKKAVGKASHQRGKEPPAQAANHLVTLFSQGRYEEVVSLAKVMTQQFPNYGFGWKVMGAALEETGKSSEALASMQRAVMLLPEDSEVHKNLGIILQALGRAEESVTSLTRSLLINPDNADAHCNLGVAFQSLGRPAEAEGCYRRAIELKPTFAEAHNNLGTILHARGQLDDAERSYRRALEINPGFADAYGNLGTTLYAKGHMVEALADFQQRARLTPGNAVDQHLIASLTGENTLRAPVKYVESVFDSYASSFDTHLQHALKYEIPKKLLALVSRNPPNADKWDVLDMGCGTGLVGKEFAPFAKSMVGVDLSRKMLEQADARKLYQRLVQSDLLPMMQGEATSSFDVIASADVFIYLGKLDEVIAEVGRLLRPGGIFAFSVENCDASSSAGMHADVPDYQLKNTGRYGQSIQYLERLSSLNDLRVRDVVATTIRTDHGNPIDGHICLWEKVPVTTISTKPDSFAADQLLRRAVICHQSGQMQEAESLYREILKVQPSHPEANHNLGVLAVQSNKPENGLPHFLVALETEPTRGQYWLSYIDALSQAGQLDTAREVLALARQHGLSGDDVDALELQLADGGPSVEQSETDAKADWSASQTASSTTGQSDKIKSNESNSRTVNSGPNQGRIPAAPEIDTLLALFNQGNYAEAASHARTMTVRFPQYGFGWKALGTVLKLMGKNAEALVPMHEALALLPDDPEVHNNMGIALQDLGQLDEAQVCFRKALQLNPKYADAYSNLGAVLQEMGRIDEAVISYRQALEIDPALAGAHYNLGNAYRVRGRLTEAADCYRDALHIKPTYVEANCNLGTVLNDLGRLEEAETTLRRVLAIKPDHVEAHGNLGNTLKELGRSAEAETSYRRALELNPNLAEVHNNLGNLLQDMGRLDEAEASYRQAMLLKPDYHKAHSNLLFLLNYNPRIAPEIAFEEARKFGQRVADEVAAPFTAWSCGMQPVRLRIGFVSGDFRNHPVGYFLENLLQHLDRTSLELIAYPTDPWVDEATERFRPYFSTWKPLYGLNDEAAARQIHSDGIHILIDLSGHSRYNRLPVFAWKPAPVQISWLGYFATTGVAEIDYLIADPWTLLETEEKYFTERIWRLPETRLCFTPPAVEVEVSSLPALANGYVTFGCFNNLTKMNDGVVELWSHVLAAVPDSRLFLKSKQLGDASVRRRTIERFSSHGIVADRLVMEGAESRAKYLSAYHRVDISLDPFPYPGGATTVESLWMGVPVLNLAGQSFLFRQGAGFLMNAGLPGWFANDPEEYVALAALYAGDQQSLAVLRNGLRQQVAASPIMNGRRLATYFGAAMQDMWREWHEGSR